MIDSLLTAPNKNISISSTLTINEYFRAGGAPCDGFTEISGSSGGTIHFANGAVAAIDNVLLTNIAATGSITPLTVNGIDNEGNAGFVIDTPIMASRTLYWVGGSGDWNDRSHWSETSGGSGGACIPFIADNVVFDHLSGLNAGTVTTSGNAYCHDMMWTPTLTGNPIFNESTINDLRLYGSVVLNPNVTINAMLFFVGEEDVTLTTNGSAQGTMEVRIRKSGELPSLGTVAFLDDWSNTQGRIVWLRGDVDVQERILDINAFQSSQSLGGIMYMQNANITVNSWEHLNSSKSVDASGSSVLAKTKLDIRTGNYHRVECSAISTSAFNVGNATFDYLTFSNPSSTSGAAVLGNNTIGTLEFKGRGAIQGSIVVDSLIMAENRNLSLYGGSLYK